MTRPGVVERRQRTPSEAGEGRRRDTSGAWCRPPERLELADGEVHVWRARLGNPCRLPPAARSWLSHDEKQRARRFVFDVDRERYETHRCLLRMLLGRYLGVLPEDIRLKENARSKPALQTTDGGPTLEFNASHCGGLAVYAFAWRRRVGIDVERVRPGLSERSIAERFFSRGEVRALRALPVHHQEAAFFAAWTRKEALLKALGLGLTGDLAAFDVSVDPQGAAVLLGVRGHLREAWRLWLTDFVPARGYRGCLAVAGRPERVSYWNWVEACARGEASCVDLDESALALGLVTQGR